MARKAYLMTSMVVLAGCSHLPSTNLVPSLKDYDPSVGLEDLPAAFEGQSEGEALDANAALDLNWVGEFDQTGGLETIIGNVLANNPSLGVVKAAREQALAGLKGDRAGLFPTVQFSATESGAFSVLNNRNPLNPERNTLDWASSDRLRTNWEIDLWGSLRKAVEAGEASLLAAEFNLVDLELSLTGQSVTTTLNLAAIGKLIDVANDTLAARQKIVNLTERRLLKGATSALDVRTARSALAGAEANLASQTQTQKEIARSLNVLMGRYPSESVDADLVWPSLGKIKVVGGPLELLARRPDVRSAEQTLVAAGLAVDQTRRALFPSLSLTGDIDQGLTSLIDNLDLDQMAIGVALSLAQTLFDGGARKAQIASAKAQAKQSLGNYMSIALTALGEVENALTADTYIALQIDAQTRALSEARAAEKIAERSYTNGLISVFELINAQTNRLDAQRALINLELSRAVNRVEFYVALGGGMPSLPVEAILPAGKDGVDALNTNIVGVN